MLTHGGLNPFCWMERTYCSGACHYWEMAGTLKALNLRDANGESDSLIEQYVAEIALDNLNEHAISGE